MLERLSQRGKLQNKKKVFAKYILTMIFTLSFAYWSLWCVQIRSVCPMVSQPNSDAEVCSRESIYSQGDRARKWENKSQIHILDGDGTSLKSPLMRGWEYLWDKEVGCSEVWGQTVEVRER